MTRKDYALIADAIKNAKAASADYGSSAMAENGAWEAARYLAIALRRNNDRFDRARFMEACGFSATD